MMKRNIFYVCVYVWVCAYVYVCVCAPNTMLKNIWLWRINMLCLSRSAIRTTSVYDEFLKFKKKMKNFIIFAFC
jgi:glycopeptide antibiotics resistance protein